MGSHAASWVRFTAAVVVPAVLATVVVAAVRSDDEDVDESATTETPTIELGASGLVVELRRPAPGAPTWRGATIGFHVDVAARADIEEIELWEDGTLVATSEPAPGSREVGQRVEWTADRGGIALITARAVDSEGRTAVSNPLWVEILDRPVTAAIDESGRVVEPDAARGADRADRPSPVGFARPPVPVSEGPGSATAGTSEQRVLPVTLDVVADGCTAEVDVGTDDGRATTVLVRIAPGSDEMTPVAEVPTGSSSIRLGAGTQGFLAVTVEDGETRAWSAPAVVTIPDGCRADGWSGEVSLAGGRLVVPAAATRAYAYVEFEPGRWRRVPESGDVHRTLGGFDLSSGLPPATGRVRVSAWGWVDGLLTHLGDGQYDASVVAPGGPSLLPSVGFLTANTLVWIEQAASGGDPEVLSDGGVIDVDANGGVLGRHRFRWSAAAIGVTHGIVQVDLEPFPDGAGPASVFPLFSCIVAGNAGEFEIDLDADTCVAESDGGQVASVSIAQQGTYESFVMSPEPLLGTSDVSPVDPLAQLEKQLYGPEAPSSTSPPWTEHRVVRVVPMMHDAWPGTTTNQVLLEIDRTPEAPPGVPAFEMDVQLVRAPRAPDLRYANCWDVVGWKDPVAAVAAIEQERQQLVAANMFAEPKSPPAMNGRLFWSELIKTNPICAPACYPVFYGPGVGGWKVGLGGADCSSDSSFWTDPVGWVVENIGGPLVAVLGELVDLASNGFAKLKGLAVDGLMELTGCTGAFCKTLAEAVVNGALIAAGIPPTLPNFDQLVQLGKGEIVALAVDLAEAAGVPCDEVGTAATFHGDEDLTCEAAVAALVDELGDVVNQQYQDAAAAGGIQFHEDLIVRPWWAGQPGDAVIDVTISPTKYSAQEQGVTCSASALTSATWKADGAIQTIAGGGAVMLPPATWQTMAYEIPTWRLPDLQQQAGGYAPATERFTITPPVAHPLVTVKSFSALFAPDLQVSPYTFYFHEGATFALHVGSACAGWETHTYTLDGSVDGALVSSEEGP